MHLRAYILSSLSLQYSSHNFHFFGNSGGAFITPRGGIIEDSDDDDEDDDEDDDAMLESVCHHCICSLSWAILVFFVIVEYYDY